MGSFSTKWASVGRSGQVSAEVLLPENRTIIEEVFRGKVFDRYGCREVSVIASECDRHIGRHVDGEALIVEIDPIPAHDLGV